MGIEYFLFAVMLFGMVLIIFFLFFYGKRRSRKQEEAEYAEKEQKLMLLYFEVQDMLDAFHEDVERVTERLQWQLEQLETEAKSMHRTEEGVRQAVPKRMPEDAAEEKEPALHGRVADLRENGMSEEEIAEKLKISRSEVGFILKLGEG